MSKTQPQPGVEMTSADLEARVRDWIVRWHDDLDMRFGSTVKTTGLRDDAIAALALLREQAEERSSLWCCTFEDRAKSNAIWYAMEHRVRELEAALRVAYPYMKDALEQGGMHGGIEDLIRADIEHVGPILAASRAALAGRGEA